MAFKGQPTPSTITQITRAKISDGKSVRVVLSDGESTKTQHFYLINGFFWSCYARRRKRRRSYFANRAS